MKNNHVTVGLLTGLDYKDPYLDPHREFQKFKQHPSISKLLKDGKMVQYGAKSAPVGGFFAVPKLTVDGALIIGDAAGLFISMQLKGLHPAIKSGMLAAETIFEALLKEDYSKAQFQNYRQALVESTVGNEIYKARNFHQLFHKGLYYALSMGGIQIPMGGSIIKSRLESDPDYTSMNRVVKQYGKENPNDEEKGDIKFDGELTFDKETDVYYSGSTHEEKQPPHLKIINLDICYNQCAKEYHNPCIRFCPANVYEMKEDEETGKKEMQLNFSNCVHCKTCDIKDPYENITWVPPEGGGGPKYTMV
jgi:electron-transferring-flavoprotein dehydrogenase